MRSTTPLSTAQHQQESSLQVKDVPNYQYQYYSPRQDDFQQEQIQTVLKPIVYEAMHVPINDQIVQVRQQMSPTANVAPQSGQIKKIISQQPQLYTLTQQQLQVQGQIQPQQQQYQYQQQQQIQQTSKFPSFLPQQSPSQQQIYTQQVIKQSPSNQGFSTAPINHQNTDRLPQSIPEFQTPNSQEKIDDRYLREMEDRIRLIKQDSDLWRQKYQLSEQDKIKNIQDIELKFQDEMHNQLISQKQIYQQSLGEMADDVKHLQRELDTSQRECEKVRKRCHQLEMEQFEMKTLYVDAQHAQQTHQKESMRLQGQLQRLRHEFEEYRTQIEIGKKRIVSEQEVDKLREYLLLREQEIDELKERNSQLEIYCIDIKKLDSVNGDLLQQIDILTRQLELLEQRLKEQKEDYQNVQQENKRLNNQLQSSKNNEKIQKTFLEQDMLSQIQNLQQQLMDKDLSLKNGQQQCQSLQSNLQQLQLKFKQQKEIYESEIDEQKNKQLLFEQEFQDSMSHKFSLLNKEIQQLQTERQQLLNDLSDLQQFKIMNESKLLQLQKDNDSFSYQLQFKGKELGINQENINILNQKLNQLSDENASLKEQIHKLHYQYQDFNKQAQQFKMVLCYIELDATRDRLTNTLKELEEIKNNQLSMYKYQ